MTDLKHQTPKQRRHFTYMMDVMRRLEWDLHNTVEAAGRIPHEWHQIAQATPQVAGVKVNLRMDADVVKFFKSMGTGYGPRINDVLKSYMHARLAGVIQGAEALNHHQVRETVHGGSKPDFDEEKPGSGESFAIRKARVMEAIRYRNASAGTKA